MLLLMITVGIILVVLIVCIILGGKVFITIYSNEQDFYPRVYKWQLKINREMSINLVDELWTGRPRNRCSNSDVTRDFSLNNIQSDFEANPAPHWMGTGDYIFRREAAGAWSCHSLHVVPKLRIGGCMPPLPNTSLCHSIVTCRVVRVTKITGSSSDDWIYWHFGYSISLDYS
jgi:hypothetical protein